MKLPKFLRRLFAARPGLHPERHRLKPQRVINIAQGPDHSRRGSKDHIVVSGMRTICGMENSPTLPMVDVIPVTEFEEWVRENPARHGFRRGLCMNCRRLLPQLLDELRNVA